MSWYPIAFFPPQFENTSGVPYSGAVLKAYAAGTSTNIPMATGSDGATTAASLALNASGYPVYSGAVVIPHIQEDYKLVLYPNQAAATANSGALWTVDNITIANSTNTSFFQSFDGDGSNKTFTLSEDLGNDENVLMVFADRDLQDVVTNGTFSSDTAWTKGAGWTIGAGVATAAGAISTDLSQTSATHIIAGQSYTVAMTITRSAGSITPNVGGTAGTARSSAGTYTETIIAGATQTLAFNTSGFTGTVDAVTIKTINPSLRQILRPDEYTLVGNQLTLTDAPPSGTKNVLVFAPSLLLGAAASAAAAAAISEANALTYANAASASAAAAVTVSGFEYEYDSSTTGSDPGSGKVRFNNATLASATAMYISETTNESQAVAAELATWDDSTSTIHGKLRVVKQTDATIFALFNITGTLTDNGTWDTFTLAYVAGNGSLSDTDILLIQYIRNGDKGDTGSIGPAGGLLPIAAAGGTADAITADFSPDVTIGDKVIVAVVNTAGPNTTTTPSFTPDSGTLRTITTGGGQPCPAGATGQIGYVMLLEYNSANTRYELLNSAQASAHTTGDVKLTLKTTADSGWVMADDGTIGSASSGATTRANADTSALYTLLWTNVSNTYAAVSTGRGVSAAADFAANKTIALTKMLGRALGLAGAGSTLTSRSLGETAGEETHALSTGELATHTHSVTDPGHVHVEQYNSAGGGGIGGTGSNASTSPLSSGTPNTLSATTGITIANAGSGTAHNNMQPTAFLNVMIKL